MFKPTEAPDFSLCEEIQIEASVDRVGRALHDIQTWLGLLPGIEDLIVTYNDGKFQEYQMSVRAPSGTVARIRTIRQCDADRILFFQPEPQTFLDFYRGDWAWHAHDDGTTSLGTKREWALNQKAGAIFPSDGVTTTEQRVASHFRQHARSLLESWKKILEGGAQTIDGTIHIEASLDDTYDAFARIDHWPRAIPAIQAVESIYDDEQHQEFLMTVERNQSSGTVRVVRFLEPGKWIEFFQPEPLPGLATLRGRWSFDRNDRGTDVEGRISFSLVPDREGQEDAVIVDLMAFLQSNLALFKRYVENRPV
jgi:hypothetical protein